MPVGIIKADVHLMLNTEKNQIAGLQMRGLNAFTHMNELAGGDAFHGQIKPVFQRPPDKA